jgi:hypothetical protein
MYFLIESGYVLIISAGVVVVFADIKEPIETER